MQKLIRLIDQSKVINGGRYDIEKRLMKTTIMKDVNFEDTVNQEEIFGSIVPIILYHDLDKTIAKVKSIAKPLSCYVCKSKSEVKDKILHEISLGCGCMNNSVSYIANSNLSFEGVDESGTGDYHCENGFKTFSHFKSILYKSTVYEANLKYYPHTK
jgi:aldehyde dehydrogenase (NAD+)